MKQNLLWLIGMILLLSFLQCGPPKDKLINGMVAPDIQLKDQNGDLLALSQISKNKITIIDFWASWCKPCLETHETLAEIYEEYKDTPIGKANGVEIYSVSLDDKEITWRNALDKHPMPWPHQVIDTLAFKSELLKTYHFEAVPTVYVIDERGVVIHKNPTKNWLLYDFRRRNGD